MAQLSLTFLGGFQARQASGLAVTFPTKKAQALLAYLAARPGRVHPRDKLAALLWGETGEDQARHSLRQTLFVLRKVLPETKPPSLLIEADSLALNPAVFDVDVAAFERLSAEGTPEALEQAATLYQGDFLEGLDVKESPFEEWLLAERERFRELALEALAKLLAHQSKAGATERAVQTAVRLLVLDSSQETVHRTLMQLYAQQGRRGAALRQYQVCVEILQRELGVEPEAETKQLYQEILQRRSQPAPTTEAPPLRTRRGRSRTSPVAPTQEIPLIGREPELARLRQALKDAWRGRGQIVAVLGEAGIGKSRLIGELATHGLRRGGRVLLGRSYEAEQILPFRPWVDALRTGKVIPKVEGLIRLGVVWRVELGRLFPELWEPGLQLTTAAQDYLRLFEAVDQLLELLTSRQPLLFILEDLHWADEMSLRLLSFLSHRLESRSVLVVATAREEELAGAALLRQVLRELDREQRLVQLILTPLSRPETMMLVRALARTDTEETLTQLGEQVWVISEGNPFMVVESMRARQEGTTPQAPGGLTLPQRVRDVVAGRLERLSEQSRELVAVASIIGREFDFPVLRSAAGLGDHEAAKGVEELVRRRILHGVGEHFDFTHDWIREVAYGQLLPPRQKLLHGLVAKTLEQLYAETLEPHYAALAVHYREADRPEKAGQYALLAGDVAARRYAYAEATARYQDALAVARRLPLSPEASRLQTDASLMLAAVGITRQDLERDLKNLELARVLAEDLRDEARSARLLYWLGRIHYVRYDPTTAIEYARQSLMIADRLGDDSLAAPPVNLLGRLYWLQSDYGNSIQMLERSIVQMRRLGNRAEEATTTGFAGWVFATVGEFDQALSYTDSAIRLAQEIQNPFAQAAAYMYRGYVREQRGEWMRAIKDYEEARCIAEQAGDLFRVYLVKSWEGRAYGMTGDPVRGRMILEESLALAEQIGTKFLLGLQKISLADCLLALDECNTAASLCHEAIRWSEESGNKWAYAVAHRTLAEAYSRLDPFDLSKAEDAMLKAIRMHQEIGANPELARTYVSYARLLKATEEREKARECLTQAIRMFREMGMAWNLERAEQALAS